MINKKNNIDIDSIWNDKHLEPLSIDIQEYLSDETTISLTCTFINSSRQEIIQQSQSLLNTPIRITLYQATSHTIYRGIIFQTQIHEHKNNITITIKTSLSLLKLNNRFKVYSHINYPDIIKNILTNHINQNDTKFKFLLDNLKGSYSIHESITQYNESDYHFLHRILEKTGINYYFSFDNEYSYIHFYDDQDLLDNTKPTILKNDHNTHNPNHSIVSLNRISKQTYNTIQLLDYDYTNLNKDLNLTKSNYEDSDLKQTIFPGCYTKKDTGQQYLNSLFNQLQSEKNIVQAVSSTILPTVGSFISITNNNDATTYFLNKVNKKIRFENHFSTSTQPSHHQSSELFCNKANIHYQTIGQYKTPVIHGTSIAKVISSNNKTIDTNKYGCIKIQFIWDSNPSPDQSNDNIAYIRVLQSQAGNASGMLWIPRAGEEVLVSFQNGDIDKPVIIGSAYNENNTPPYTLPKNKFTTGIKIVSTSDKQFFENRTNEIQFNNKQKEEKLLIKAERNLTEVAANNAYSFIQGNLEHTVSKGNTTISSQNGSINLQAHKTINLQVGASQVYMNTSHVTIESTVILLNPKTISPAQQQATTADLQNHQTLHHKMVKGDVN